MFREYRKSFAYSACCCLNCIACTTVGLYLDKVTDKQTIIVINLIIVLDKVFNVAGSRRWDDIGTCTFYMLYA